MSAGVCGKRVGFEEICGSSSPTSAKRSRCSNFGSLVRSGSDDPVSVLLQMFPDLDPEVLKSVLRNHENNIEDATDSLRAISFGNNSERNRPQGLDSTTVGNCSAIPGESASSCSQMAEEEVGDANTTIHVESMTDGSKWVDLFVNEMMSAKDLDDARGRAARILEAFERSIIANSKASKEFEHASLKEHLQSLLNDNQILKKAVSIQHERHLEQEQKDKEIELLKVIINQYQEQARNLELRNYALKLHLQRAQDSSTIPGQFHPDIF
ncbi:Ubiquitin system component Cue [Melia azedarach]|uniref:Ubiquitin system component Cue n=2 Tax=Melia azedarach TaxID=155640 RepID=A0ACC1X0M8_MELAZ|nr:Ubiquitin system component Cue [Melia azedarach]KAJ4704726.1 Ubiquitin system component Cue [Melia azedarach]